MNHTDRLHLIAEKKFLQERIQSLPDSARLMKMSVESRLRNIEEKLGQAVDEAEPARLNLTFNGRPVVGSHGIFAEFGMEAVSKFNEAVTAIAASIAAPLAAMGPIPNRAQNQLLITNTVIGSFGFELEENRSKNLPVNQISPVAQALERAQTLLQSTVGTDDQLADSAAETDPRALDKIRSFLNVLAENDAVCALQFKDSSFRFQSVEQVRTSLDRLSRDNLREEEIELLGRFDGYLPSRRTFDLILESGEVVTGKVSSAVEQPDEINQHLGEVINIRVMRTMVGNGRPRYSLLRLPQWNSNLLT